MNYKAFGNTILLRLDPGEEILASLKALCLKENIALGAVSGIGAVNRAVLGLFETAAKQYHANTFEMDMEIVSLAGNISTMDGAPYLHLHMAVSDARGRAFGGHLSEAVVSATAEIMVTRIDGAAGRRFDEGIGLNLLEV